MTAVQTDATAGAQAVGQGRTGTTGATDVRAFSEVRRLTDLLDRRPDLAGVNARADLTAEAVRWSA
jgi:hypothetical protein